MRITGGSLGGRTVTCPPGEIRPTTDRMRESLFAQLGDLEGCSFLDLFCGSGVAGLEAVSRGARPVVLVERDRGKLTILKRNLLLAGDAARLVVAPVEPSLQRCRQPFDLVFLDPPYRYPDKGMLVRLACRPHVSAPGGSVLLHLPAREDPPPPPAGTALLRYRRYGQSALCFYGSEAVTGPSPPD